MTEHTQPSEAALTYVECLPAMALRRLVRCYWQVRGHAAPEGTTRRVLPDGCADVLFELGDQNRHASPTDGSARWVGTMTQAIVVRSHGRVDTLGVRFAPGGLWALSRLPVHLLTDGHVTLADSDPLGLRWLVEPLIEAQEFAARAQLLDTALLDALGRAPSLPTIATLLCRLDRIPSIPTVAGLEDLAGSSSRTLERRFREEVGVGPKQYLRFLRFDRAHRLLAGGHAAAEVAAEVGYADQAHFSHEFRRFGGLSPSKLARERGAPVGFLQDDPSRPRV